MTMQEDAIKDLKEIREKYYTIPCKLACGQCPLYIKRDNDEDACIFWVIDDLEWEKKRFRVGVSSYVYVDAFTKDEIYDMDLDIEENLTITDVTEVYDDD